MEKALLFEEENGVCEYEVKCIDEEKALEELANIIYIGGYNLHTSSPYVHGFITKHIAASSEEMREKIGQILCEEDNELKLTPDVWYYGNIGISENDIFKKDHKERRFPAIQYNLFEEYCDFLTPARELASQMAKWGIPDDRKNEYIKEIFYPITGKLEEVETLQRILKLFELEFLNLIPNTVVKITEEVLDKEQHVINLGYDVKATYDKIQLARRNTETAKILSLNFHGIKK